MRKHREKPIAEARVLALDPLSRGFGFVVLEGTDSLLDWGVAHVAHDPHPGSLERIDDLIDRYRPAVVVLEHGRGAGSRRGETALKLIGAVTRLARARGLDVEGFSRADVRRAFAGADAVTKEEIAAEIAIRFPELAVRVPPHRKPWMPEARSMAIFDAASFVLAYF